MPRTRGIRFRCPEPSASDVAAGTGEKHMDLKQAAISIAMVVFVLSSMLGMGLGLRVSEIVAPLRNWRLVALSLVANFVIMPLAALTLARAPAPGRVDGDWPAAAGAGRRRTFPSEACADRQRQSRVCASDSWCC